MIRCTFESGSAAALRHVVVHAILVKDEALLLVRRAERLTEGGKWGLPGGFLDRDESLAEGTLREVREETGWEGEIGALLRVNSRPDRRHEDRQNVAFDFLVRPIREVGEPDSESSAVAWVPLTDLPALDTLAFDHGDSVAWYLRHRHTGFPPPIVL